MALPLHSDDSALSTNMQFAHFGVLDAGAQSKSSFLTSITINLILAVMIVLIGAASQQVLQQNRRVAMLVAPITMAEPEPVKATPVKLPPPPVIKEAPPKIVVPEVKLPDPPKVPVVHMDQPMPVSTPAPPKLVNAPPAPRPVSLARPEVASVVNNNPHPAAVALGRADSPIAVSNRPATASVDLGQRGMAGMPGSNSGDGLRSANVNLGSGQPGGQNMTGTGARAVQGVALGRSGGTGALTSTGRNAAGQVNLGVVQQPAMPRPAVLSATPVRNGPKVLFKPRPDYTAEARALHLEGTVSVRLHVSSTGAVTVIGIGNGNGLGHGLDESARRAVQSTRFQPAVDNAGHPVDWDGVVNVIFQMAD